MSTTAERMNNLSPSEKRALAAELLRRKAEQPRSYTLSFAQQRLWFLDQLEPGNAAYNVFTAVRLKGSLEVSAFEQTFKEIIARHESLRTSFPTVDGEPVQLIHRPRPFKLPLLDLSGWPREQAEAEARRLAMEESRRPFDLARGDLLRVTLLRLDEREHVLLFASHHIISDDWSMGVLIKEVAALYDAYAKGRPSPLPELAIQYADFARWQRQRLQGETLETEIAYWKQQLDGSPQMLEMPADFSRPPVPGYRGASQSLTLPESLVQKLRLLSRRENVTLFMTLLAAFKALLHRYTRQEDILVGSTIANRNRAEVESLIGFFVNTLVLRTDLSGDPTFRQLLGRVREVALGAYAHQDLPFEKLVDELQAGRNPNRTPFFQVVFQLVNAQASTTRLAELSAIPFELENDVAKFDLTLTMIDSEHGITALLKYNTDLFEAATAARLLNHLQTLLESAAANPDGRISQLEMVNHSELHQLLQWSHPSTSPAPARCLHHLFEQQASRAPSASALLYQEHSFSYALLNQRANQLAHHLISLGAAPDALIALCLERSTEMVVALLAVLKAGAAYLPLDPAYPEERLSFMLSDAQAGIIITQQHLLDALPPHKAQVICLDADWPLIEQESRVNPETDVTPDNLAYVIYTSGSTGQPKGVMVSHHNVSRLLSATDSLFHFDSSDVWSFFHSFAFDFSVWELWGALAYGGRVVVVPYLTSRSPEQFYEMLCREGVTVLNQTPSAFRQLLQVDERLAGAEQIALEESGEKLSLRLVIFGGEALQLSTLRSWYARHAEDETQLVNMYGITETTVHVTSRLLCAADAESGRGSLIGRAIADLSLYVVGEGMEVTGIGVAGELYVGGGGVARGYLRRAELTAERFVPDGLSGEAGARLYRTGDVGRYLASGEVEYLGRVDEQVKVRGYRIELGEVESALRKQRGVKEAVVVVRDEEEGTGEKGAGEKGGGEKQLVGYVVWEGEGEMEVSEMRRGMRREIPEYMIPGVYVRVEEIVLTRNGKVDRKALPKIGEVRRQLEKPLVAPQTALEETIAGVWREVLQLEEVSVEDSFFDLGGHSILIVQVQTKLQHALGVELSIVDLFQFATIRALAQRLSGLGDERSKLSEAQERAETRRESSKRQRQARRNRAAGKLAEVESE
jgi:amino acid adenylation domain-containing protein